MKKLILLCILFFCRFCFAFDYPSATIFFNSTLPSTVFYGETLRIPVQMNYSALRYYHQWKIPAGSHLEVTSGACPVLAYQWI
jgi:hypothetical protein